MKNILFINASIKKTISRNERSIRKERVHARSLQLESLESRDLLSVAPGGEFLALDALAAYESGDAARADVLDFSGATLDGGESQNELNSTSIVVTSELDVVDENDGVVTLREVLTDAESGDTITFDNSLQGKTITLDAALGELTVNQSLTIDASNLWDTTASAPGLTISGQGATRILRVIGGTSYVQNHLNVEIDVGISGITFTNGYSGDYGGAIRSTGATLALDNCVISNNEAASGGGVSSTYYGNTTLTNCVLTNNIASGGNAGAIYSEAMLALNNCLICDNEASGNGGGVYVRQQTGSMTLTNCTVTNNTASVGGGVYLDGSAPVFNAYNSIIVGNSGSSLGVDFYSAGDSGIRAYHTLSSYSKWKYGENNLTYDVSQPLFTNTTTGDYTLVENSQAIDKGDNQYVAANVDLAGNLRVSGGTVDLGAYEYQSVVEQETLATPTGLRETGKTETTITVAWDDVENASGYRLAWKSKTDASYTYVPLEASATSYTQTNLESGATYEWKVQALGDGINYIDSVYSGPRSVATLLKLSVPSNPSETEKTETTVTVTWNAVENANGYQLAWRNENDSEYVYVLLEALTTSYTIDELEGSVTYEWKVQALGDGINYIDSEYSRTRSVATLLQLEEPILDEALATETTITVAWGAVENANGYRLAWKSENDSEYVYVSLEASTTSYTIDRLESGTTYEWKVQALGDGSNYTDSVYSEMSSVATLLKLEEPILMEATPTDTTITVAWYTVENANGYRLAWKNEIDASYTYFSLDASTTSYTLTDLESGATYEWKVQALGDGISYTDSVYSETSSVVTLLKLEEPIPVDATPTETTITVVWESAENASGYRLAWKNETDSEYVFVMIDENTTSYTLDGLESGATYEWKVQALGDGIIYTDSVYSETLSAETLLKLEEPILMEATPTDTTITVAWYTVENANGYRLAWKNEIDASYTYFSLDASTTSYTLTDLESGATYEWKVQALGDGVSYIDSVYSETSSVVTLLKLEEPIPVDATPTETTITVVWESAENASGYRLAWKNETDSEYVFVMIDENTTSYTLDGLESGATYEWKVQALGDGSIYADSIYSETLSATTLLKLEEPILSVTTKTETTITVSWEAVENANGYQLVWKNEKDVSYTYVQLDASTTSYTLTDLDSGATYEWAVQALGDGIDSIDSGYSEPLFVATLLKLDAPTVASADVDMNSITVAWDEVQDATRYSFAYKLASETTWTSFNAGTALNYTIYGLQAESEYVVRVRARGDGDCRLDSNWSKTVVVTTEAGEAFGPVFLSAPTDVSTEVDNNSITVAWDEVPDATRYSVAYKLASETTWTSFNAGTALSYTIYGLQAESEYNVRVRARGDGDCYLDSNWSKAAFVTTEAGESGGSIFLSAPTIVSTEVDKNSITVAWDEVQDATRYSVAYKLASETTWTNFNAGTALSYTIYGLQAESEYNVRVRARGDGDSHFDSNWSKNVLVTTEAGETVGPIYLSSPAVVSTEVDKNTITVVWGNVSNAIRYSVSYKLANETTWKSFNAKTALSYTITELESDSEYNIRVRARGDGSSYFDSNWSKVAVVKTDEASFATLDLDDEFFEELDEEDYDLLAANFIV